MVQVQTGAVVAAAVAAVVVVAAELDHSEIVRKIAVNVTRVTMVVSLMDTDTTDMRVPVLPIMAAVAEEADLSVRSKVRVAALQTAAIAGSKPIKTASFPRDYKGNESAGRFSFATSATKPIRTRLGGRSSVMETSSRSST